MLGPEIAVGGDEALALSRLQQPDRIGGSRDDPLARSLPDANGGIGAVFARKLPPFILPGKCDRPVQHRQWHRRQLALIDNPLGSGVQVSNVRRQLRQVIERGEFRQRQIPGFRTSRWNICSR